MRLPEIQGIAIFSEVLLLKRLCGPNLNNNRGIVSEGRYSPLDQGRDSPMFNVAEDNDGVGCLILPSG